MSTIQGEKGIRQLTCPQCNGREFMVRFVEVWAENIMVEDGVPKVERAGLDYGGYAPDSISTIQCTKPGCHFFIFHHQGEEKWKRARGTTVVKPKVSSEISTDDIAKFFKDNPDLAIALLKGDKK